MDRRESRVELDCHWCGAVQVPVTNLRCAVDRTGRGLSEVECPYCQRWIFTSLVIDEVELLLTRGARRADAGVPLELLEPHGDSTLSVDDVIRSVMEIAAAPYPQEELIA